MSAYHEEQIEGRRFTNAYWEYSEGMYEEPEFDEEEEEE